MFRLCWQDQTYVSQIWRMFYFYSHTDWTHYVGNPVIKIDQLQVVTSRALTIFQSHRDLQAGDNQSPKFKRRDQESSRRMCHRYVKRSIFIHTLTGLYVENPVIKIDQLQVVTSRVSTIFQSYRDLQAGFYNQSPKLKRRIEPRPLLRAPQAKNYNHSTIAAPYRVVTKGNSPPRWCRSSGLDFGSEDPGSIPRLPSPRVGPLMARR